MLPLEHSAILLTSIIKRKSVLKTNFGGPLRQVYCILNYCAINAGGGLTTYAEQPSNLSAPLEVCLKEAQNKIPSDKHKTTPVFLGATAGMRMLK